MRIKYSPCKSLNKETNINIIDNNSITVDGEVFDFDTDSIIFPDIVEQTNGVILEAHRYNNELYITVRRFYIKDCSLWDTGEYNEVNRQDC